MRNRIAGALTVAALAALLLVGCGSDKDDASSTTSTSAEKTTTTADVESTTTTTEGTTTTVAPSTEQPATAVWPFASSETRFADPAAAAESFATEYLGFTDPQLGEFQQGDTRSGEIALQRASGSAVTTILLRQVTDDDSWWVIGASTSGLQLESPEVLAAITSPVTVSGQSTAFEATINIELRQDDTLTPLVETIAMGGSNGEMGPFSTSIEFGPQTADGGAIVLKTLSAMDGAIMEATVVRVSFGG